MARRYGKRKYYGNRKKDPFYRFNKGDSIAIKALKMASNVKRALNVEFKESIVDQNIPNVTAAATVANSQIWCLNGLTQGIGSAQREGNQVEFKSLSIHGWFAGTSTTDHIARLILFKVKGLNGATPTQAELLDGASAPAILDFYNLDNVPQNYQVLADKTYSLHYNNDQFKKFSLHLNDMNCKTRYQGTSSAYTDISTNAIFAMVVVTDLTGAPAADMRVVSRIRYVDN